MVDHPTQQEQTVEWLGLRVRLPNEWQVVRHGVSPRSGSLVFVDRRRERMRVAWHACESEPDLEHMLRDQRRKEQAADAGAEIDELAGVRGWVGLRIETSSAGAQSGPPLAGSRVVTRAVRYDARYQRLLEVLFTTPAQEPPPEDMARIRRVLRTLKLTSPPEQATRLQLFDVVLCTPPGYRLEKTSVKPADVTLDFRAYDAEKGRFGRARASVRRMAMASVWYQAEPQAVLRREWPKIRFSALAETQHAKHTAVAARGPEPGPRLMRLLGRGLERRVLLWHCDVEDAVYRVATLSPRRGGEAPEAFRVECCGELHG